MDSELGHDSRYTEVAMPAERILVVDDEDTIREIVCSMLAAANYKTTAGLLRP